MVHSKTRKRSKGRRRDPVLTKIRTGIRRVVRDRKKEDPRFSRSKLWIEMGKHPVAMEQMFAGFRPYYDLRKDALDYLAELQDKDRVA